MKNLHFQCGDVTGMVYASLNFQLSTIIEHRSESSVERHSNMGPLDQLSTTSVLCCEQALGGQL